MAEKRPAAQPRPPAEEGVVTRVRAAMPGDPAPGAARRLWARIRREARRCSLDDPTWHPIIVAAALAGIAAVAAAIWSVYLSK